LFDIVSEERKKKIEHHNFKKINFCSSQRRVEDFHILNNVDNLRLKATQATADLNGDFISGLLN